MKKIILAVSVVFATMLFSSGSCANKNSNDNAVGGTAKSTAVSASGKDLVAELEKLAASTDGSLFLVAHRGNTYDGIMRSIPENSVGAIEKSIAAGADMIEIDVRTTSDGEFVLMHDVKVDRTTDGKGPVSEMTLAEIRALRQKALNGTQTESVVPTLEEALLAGRGKVFFDLDVAGKHNDLAKMTELVKSLGMIDQVMFWINNDMDDLGSIKSAAPDGIIFPGAQSVERVDYWSANDERVRVMHLFGIEDTREIVDHAAGKGIVCLFNSLGDVDKALVDGDRSGIDKIKAAGVRVIQTDVIEKVRDATAKH